MMKNRKRLARNFIIIVLSAFVTIFIVSKLKPSKKSQICRDWHDYKLINEEKVREGFGEHGIAAYLTNPLEKLENEKIYNKTGVSVLISNKISVNRSIPDSRHVECQSVKYPTQLPSVSVIIIFHNEAKSVLLRTIHSVINRTPKDLLHEVILVNDKSSDEELYEPLEKYVSENFNGKVKIKNLSERKGLIVTRLEGAKIAEGEVLVFFDSHIEVNTNWLPPLLTPIKYNRRLATVPTIDDFHPETFEYYGNEPYRGGIDWQLTYQHFKRYLPEGSSAITPFPNPIMLGCAFAIDRKFFMEELDGYDREYKIWNAENYELSFKLWLCADGLFAVPCSRVAHTFRKVNPSRDVKEDFLTFNFKRLVEVWLGKYKQAVYDRDPEKYSKVDPGDLTHVNLVRDRLKCKPFKYFMTDIAPDFLVRYPLEVKSPVFASGQIKSLARSDTCIDIINGSDFNEIGIYYCDKDFKSDTLKHQQLFRLSVFKNINFGYQEFCLDTFKLSLPQCHYAEFGNQIWKYDYKKNLIFNVNEKNEEFCITGNFSAQSLFLAKCDESDEAQKWKFTYENKWALDRWDEIYGYEKLVYGNKGYKKDKMEPVKDDKMWKCN